ncbi:glutamine-hydrolyzing GMP synthase [Candidatus Poribacteria bacterium]|nr:glutamine-hydrolyzing GMP synthase [Candidatus Poribacteria bacterium]
MRDPSQDMIVVLDFGSQTTQLIARRVRELNVYCEIHPYYVSPDVIDALRPNGIILSGGPASVYEDDAPKCAEEFVTGKRPVLGICYGMQLMTQFLGGEVAPTAEREYGHALVEVDRPTRLTSGVTSPLHVWMSHGDRLDRLPDGFEAVAKSENSPVAIMADAADRRFGLQFHPEVVHTKEGHELLANFVLGVCGCSATWTMESFVETTVRDIRAGTQGKRVLSATSGGVDSTVLSKLMRDAIGDRVVCLFVDNGLLRKDEAAQVRAMFRDNLDIELHFVDATDRFLEALEGVAEPEAKRRIIGNTFIEVFEDALTDIGGADFLAQGTLYPDVIESVSVRGPSSTIKTHHNVGGLPEDLRFELIEPFRELFKDEVRAVGRELDIPKDMLGRHPFPGPGLAVRVLGDITRERLDVLREADAIFIEELHAANLYDSIWQAFAVLLPVSTVGVMGDARTYENVVALRAVHSRDGMTADWYPLPHDLLGRASNRIINEVKGVNRVCYDISSKPPATIEWE